MTNAHLKEANTPSILDSAGNGSRKSTKSGERSKKSALTPSISLQVRWQDLAGEELEQIGDYSSEDRHFEKVFVHEYEG